MLATVAEYPDRVWAVEGANGMGRSIAQRLVGIDERVYEVPVKLATRVRVCSTGHATKTDNTDALAIARAALHSRHLRVVKADDETVALKLLSDRRKELIGLRTQAVCRLHRLLRELIPGGGLGLVTGEMAFDLVNDLQLDDPAGLMQIEIALEHIEDIMRIDLKIDVVSKRIHAEIKASATTLTRVYGIGPINAALIIGEVGDVSRFPSRDHFASYAGTAPVAASSGDHQRHRLNSTGLQIRTRTSLGRAGRRTAATCSNIDRPTHCASTADPNPSNPPPSSIRCCVRDVASPKHQHRGAS